ncbi:MAG: tRNA pseudouridine(38-40) synthase TruA [Ferruginibacter sp.]|nr:tRNA pseudouridine(38-40) synthase TruA [Ferruginibacter sp.]
MAQRYFIELAYKGGAYSGFQIQQNAPTIQGEVERALKVFFKADFSLTGSSRTDAGVNALQNYFHFDVEKPLSNLDQAPYHLNAILPTDIVIKGIYQVEQSAHCRFDALSRSYEYRIYSFKNPFLEELAFYFPYRLDVEVMQQAALLVKGLKQFEAFSKKHAQVNNFECTIYESEWRKTIDGLSYFVTGNRFLRGMVRGLVATMLRVGTGKISVDEFEYLLNAQKQASADFSAPGHGLYLSRITFPSAGIFTVL